jgi:hypothetical protein
MLDKNYQQQLKLRLSQTECRIQVPRSMAHLFRPGSRAFRREDDRRRFQRFAFPKKVLLEIETTIPGIERTPEFFAVLTLDLCLSGVAFLHCQELFPGETPWVWFQGGKVRCRIARCLRHNARCFEIGAAFEDGPQSASWLRRTTGQLQLAQRA